MSTTAVSTPDPLAGGDADLKLQSGAEEKILTVSTPNTPGVADVTEVTRQSAQYFTSAGKIGAILGAVDTQEIKVVKQTAVFRPYWRLSAGYACRYIRRHEHKLLMERDVESALIHGSTQPVMGEGLKLDEILARAGSSTDVGYGTAKVGVSTRGAASGVLPSLLGTRDLDMETKVEVSLPDVLETARYVYTGRFLFDATLSTESKEIFDMLQRKDLYPVTEAALKEKGMVLEPVFGKEEVVEEVRKRLSQKPEESPRKIIEQEFLLSELSLIYLPYTDYSLEYKGNAKTVRLDGTTGEVKEI